VPASPSVPDVESTEVSPGVPSSPKIHPVLAELMEAADALAFEQLASGAHTSTTFCKRCWRGQLGDAELIHEPSCPVGRAIRATWAVRALLASPMVILQTAEQFAVPIEELRMIVKAYDAAAPVSEEGATVADMEDEAAAIAARQFGAPLLDEVRPNLPLTEKVAGHCFMDRPDPANPGWCDICNCYPHDCVFADQAGSPERTIICGALFPGSVGAQTQCELAPGHDGDPESSHFSKKWGFTWPTAARIAQEMRDEASL